MDNEPQSETSRTSALLHVLPITISVVFASLLLPFALAFFLSQSISDCSIRESTSTLWLPIICTVSAGSLYMWLVRPRLKVFYTKRPRFKMMRYFDTISIIAFLIPAMLVPHLILSENSELLVIDSILEINRMKLSRYYQIRNLEVRKDIASYDGYRSAERGSDRISICVVSPITVPGMDISANHQIWLGQVYSDYTSTWSRSEEAALAYKDAVSSALAKHGATNFEQHTFFRVLSEPDQRSCENAVAALLKKPTSKNTVFLRHSIEPFSARNKEGLRILILLLAIIYIALMVPVAVLRVNVDELARQKEKPHG